LNKHPVFGAEVTVIIQHSTRENFSLVLADAYILEDKRRYGDNALTFLKRK
jgi:hypothetical protein